MLRNVFLMLLSWSVMATSPIFEAVDWTTVPSATPAARNLNNAALGNCICDLTANACDPNCCCDTDCTVVEASYFTTCRDETVSASGISYCYSPTKATEIVTMSGFGKALDKVTPGGDAICLVQNNYPTGASPYFSVPATVLKPTTSFVDEWFIETKSTVGFEVGKNIPIVRMVNSSLTNTLLLQNVDTGFLTIPYGGSKGRCASSYSKPVPFFTPLVTSSCVANSCPMLNLSKFVESVQALANPSSTISTAVLIPMEVVVKNATTGASLFSVDTSVLRSNFPNTNSTQSNVSKAQKFTTTWDGVLCRNAVVRVKTTLTYDMTAAVRLRSAVREVFVVDVKNILAGKSVQHEVQFVKEGASQRPVSRDGNPGFASGSYIPAGILLTNSEGKQAVQSRVGGFSVPSGGRACSANQYRVVPFLHNILNSGCTVPISESDLISICSSATGTTGLLNAIHQIPTISDFPTANGTTSLLTHVAKTADASSADPLSWVRIAGIDISSPTPFPYDTAERRCDNIVVGLSYTFVVARAGAESNPQDVIVGAFADPIIGNWRIRSDDTSLNATTNQLFKFRVKFVRNDPTSQETLSRRIVAPPILPKLDDTIFYPFRMPN